MPDGQPLPGIHDLCRLQFSPPLGKNDDADASKAGRSVSGGFKWLGLSSDLVKVNYEITRPDFKEFAQWLSSRGRSQQKESRVQPGSLLLAGFGVSIGVYVAARESNPILSGGALGFGLGMMFVYALWNWSAKAALAKYEDWGPSDGGYMLGPQEVELLEEGIGVRSSRHKGVYQWTLVAGPEILKNQLYIRLDRIAAIIVPRRAFASEGEFTEFANEVRKRAKRVEPY